MDLVVLGIGAVIAIAAVLNHASDTAPVRCTCDCRVGALPIVLLFVSGVLAGVFGESLYLRVRANPGLRLPPSLQRPAAAA